VEIMRKNQHDEAQKPPKKGNPEIGTKNKKV
jgi:hypothetical protein